MCGVFACCGDLCEDRLPMSKAFTKESDGDDDDEVGLPPLPPGGKNYITPQGFERLKTELLLSLIHI